MMLSTREDLHLVYELCLQSPNEAVKTLVGHFGAIRKEGGGYFDVAVELRRLINLTGGSLQIQEDSFLDVLIHAAVSRGGAATEGDLKADKES